MEAQVNIMLRGWSWQVMAVAVVTTGVLTDGLMFHSDAVTSQWDTWAFVENGTFYVSDCARSRDRVHLH